jgi:hypothetical protein
MFKTDYTQNKYLDGGISAALIAGGAALAGTAGNTVAQGKMNRKTRKWAEKEREINRQYALQDYATMNEYNSPRAQMARFKEAGLNPNLIYGQQNEGATVRSTDQAKWNPESPNFDLGSAASAGLSAYNDTRMRDAQIDLIAKQGAVQVQEAMLKAASTAQTAAQTAKTTFETQQAQSLSKISLQAAEAGVQKLLTDTAATVQQMDINKQKNLREAITQEQSLREGLLRMARLDVENAKTAQEIKNAKQTLKNLETDNELKKADLKLKEKGVQPTDNILLRTGIQFYEKNKTKIEKGIERMQAESYRENHELKRKKQAPHGPKNRY